MDRAVTYKPQKQITKGHQYFPPADCLIVGPNAVGMGTAADWFGNVFRAPKTGNITGLKFGTRTVTVGATVRGSIQTVVGGVPSGTLAAAGASGTVVVANTDDNVIKTVTFTTPMPVTKNDLLSSVLDISSGSPSALQIGRLSATYSAAPPMSSTVISGAAANGNIAVFGISLLYDDGSEQLVAPYGFPHTQNTVKNISNITAVRELGIKFTMPFNAVSDGFQWRCVTTSAQPVDVVLYDDADNVLRTYSVDPNVLGVTSNATNIGADWPTPINVIKGRTYRLVLKPTGATGFNMIAQTQGISKKPLGLEDVSYTERGTGAWTDIADATAGIQLSLASLNFPDGSYI